MVGIVMDVWLRWVGINVNMRLLLLAWFCICTYGYGVRYVGMGWGGGEFGVGVGVRMGGVSGYVSMYGGGWTNGNWCRHGWVDGWGVEAMMIIRFDLINHDQNKKNVRDFCLL